MLPYPISIGMTFLYISFLDKNPDSLRCIEDGKIYQDGERFEKIRDGYKVSCQCMQGFSGMY